MTVILRTEGLNKSYRLGGFGRARKIQALSDVNINVESDRPVAFVAVLFQLRDIVEAVMEPTARPLGAVGTVGSGVEGCGPVGGCFSVFVGSGFFLGFGFVPTRITVGSPT